MNTVRSRHLGGDVSELWLHEHRPSRRPHGSASTIRSALHEDRREPDDARRWHTATGRAGGPLGEWRAALLLPADSVPASWPSLLFTREPGEREVAPRARGRRLSFRHGEPLHLEVLPNRHVVRKVLRPPAMSTAPSQPFDRRGRFCVAPAKVTRPSPDGAGDDLTFRPVSGSTSRRRGCQQSERSPRRTAATPRQHLICP